MERQRLTVNRIRMGTKAEISATRSCQFAFMLSNSDRQLLAPGH